MKYCQKCGKQLMDAAVICPGCGCPTGDFRNTAKTNDAPSAGFAVLGFFLPVVGLIIYLAMHNTAPLRAKSAGKGALTSVLVFVGILLLMMLITLLLSGYNIHRMQEMREVHDIVQYVH